MERNVFKEMAMEEAVGVENKTDCCRFAFLSAMMKTVGSIEISRQGPYACFTTDDYALACLIADEIKTLYYTEIGIDKSTVKSGVKKGGDLFTMKVPRGQTKKLVVDTATMTMDGEQYTGFISGISSLVVKKPCCVRAFLRGMFLGCGTVYVPPMNEDDEGSAGYHLEFQLSDESVADDLLELLTRVGVNAKTSERGVNRIVYIKDKNLIRKLLSALYLGESVMKLDDVIRERELRGSINRSAICEASNLDKSYSASTKHLLAIQIIEEREGLKSLPPQLKETAEARREHPQMTLQELADELGVTKSCLNHRMRKLLQTAGIKEDKE